MYINNQPNKNKVMLNYSQVVKVEYSNQELQILNQQYLDEIKQLRNRVKELEGQIEVHKQQKEYEEKLFLDEIKQLRDRVKELEVQLEVHKLQKEYEEKLLMLEDLKKRIENLKK